MLSVKLPQRNSRTLKLPYAATHCCLRQTHVLLCQPIAARQREALLPVIRDVEAIVEGSRQLSTTRGEVLCQSMQKRVTPVDAPASGHHGRQVGGQPDTPEYTTLAVV